MSTQKLVRLFKAGVIAEGIEVLSCANDRGHMYAELRHKNGAVQRITLPSSPSVLENSLRISLQSVRRFARESV